MWVPSGSLMRRGVGQLTTIATAIETQEGYYPGSLAYVNNNPGNLMAAGQAGCTATASGFCDFDSFADGWQALLNQIQLDASRGLTILQFTQKYAPASDGNDPTTYADNLAASVGLSPGDSLSAAIAQPGGAGAAGSTVQSIVTDAGGDWSDFLDSLTDPDNDVDLSSIGLGLVSPLVLAGVALAFVAVLFVVRK